MLNAACLHVAILRALKGASSLQVNVTSVENASFTFQKKKKLAVNCWFNLKKMLEVTELQPR